MVQVSFNNLAKAVLQGLKRLWGQGGNLVLPGRCLSCNAYLGSACPTHLSQAFCPNCVKPKLPYFSSPFCPVCGHLFAFRAQSDHWCENCLKKRPRIGQVRAAFAYEAPVTDAISQFKYQGRLGLAPALETHLFHAYLRFFLNKNHDLIIPIPLHLKKARTRGYNQAYILVRRFNRLYRDELGADPPWQLDYKSLVRKKATISQTGLDEKQRRKNLKNAFGVKTQKAVKKKRILLVDDVFTTGATCHAAAAVLLRAGALEVDVLALARA